MSNRLTRAVCLSVITSGFGGCTTDPPPPATSRPAVAHVRRIRRPATEPSLSDRIDAAALHADNSCDELKLAGMAGVISSDDQRYVDQLVDQGQRETDKWFANLKATHKPADSYTPNWVDVAGGAVPGGVEQKLAKVQPALARPLRAGQFFVQVLLPILIINPDQVGDWLSTAKVPAAAADRVKAVAAAERQRALDAGAAWGVADDQTPAAFAYARQRRAAEDGFWSAVASDLTPDQRQAFAPVIEASVSRERQFILTEARTLLALRDERGWSPAGVTTDALVDSDQGSNSLVPAAGRYSLIRADDRRVVCTVDLDKTQYIGFSFDGFIGSTLSALYGDHDVPIEAGRYVYYWVRAAANAPLVPSTTQTTFSTSDPAAQS